MEIEIGKFTLESLTTGMYSEPESCYREYIQNAVDSLDTALAEGFMQAEDFRIEIIVDGSKQEISIRDNGPGMDKEVQRRIFDPFFTTKEVGEGTGLGLSISYSIISKLGGCIRFESEVGQGTEFVILLPVKHHDRKE